jgi:hypothetical protein
MKLVTYPLFQKNVTGNKESTFISQIKLSSVRNHWLSWYIPDRVGKASKWAETSFSFSVCFSIVFIDPLVSRGTCHLDLVLFPTVWSFFLLGFFIVQTVWWRALILRPWLVNFLTMRTQPWPNLVTYRQPE